MKFKDEKLKKILQRRNKQIQEKWKKDSKKSYPVEFDDDSLTEEYPF